MVEIAGVEFEPSEFDDEWVSADGRIVLTLVMEADAVRAPWRISLDGHTSTSPYSTPFVAVIRTLKRMKRYEGQQAA